MDQYKTCTKCKKEFPATKEYFHINKLGKEGLKSYCKSCVSEQGRTLNGIIRNFNRHSRHRFPKENYISDITVDQFIELLVFFECRCAYTGEPLNDTTLSLDHLQTRTKNGIHHISNVVPCTKEANNKKYNKDFQQWYINSEYFTMERYAKIMAWQIIAQERYNY